MKARLVFVPPGGGEAEYTLEFDLPAVPRSGDYISIKRPGQNGTEDFMVRRAWWWLWTPEVNAAVIEDEPMIGQVEDLVVECEFAIGPFSDEQHLRTAQGYGAKRFEDTAY